VARHRFLSFQDSQRKKAVSSHRTPQKKIRNNRKRRYIDAVQIEKQKHAEGEGLAKLLVKLGRAVLRKEPDEDRGSVARPIPAMSELADPLGRG